MLISALLPGRAATPRGPFCGSSWTEFASQWGPGPVQRSLLATPGVSGCLVTYRYFDAGGKVARFEITHAIVLFEGPGDAAAFLESPGPTLLAFEDDQSAPDVADVPATGLRGPWPGTDAAIILQSAGSSALILRFDATLHVVSFRPAPFHLDAEAISQLTRLIASRMAASTGTEAAPAGSPRPVEVPVVVEGTVAGLAPSSTAVEDALGEVERLLGAGSHRPEPLVIERRDLNDLHEFDPGRDIPRLLTGSSDCVVEVFYVAGSGNEGGWAWVPRTAVFINARLYGERLRDPGFHGRILAHEFGHLWGLEHADDPANLMHVHGRGGALTPEQVSLLAAYLERWSAQCR